jgi:hypothetical protein
MKSRVSMAVLLSGTVFAGAASAEGPYGSGDLAANWQSIQANNIGLNSSDETGLTASGYAGYRFGAGMFVEGELRFQDMSDDDTDGVNSLQSSSLAVLRGGIDFGAATTELLIGAVEARTSEDQSSLTFGGLGGSYTLSDRVTLRGTVIHLAHEGGDGAEDVIKDATAISLGAAYGVSDQITIWGDAVYADGVMDDEREMSLVREISLGAGYAFATPGLKAYGSLSYADLYQGGEEDSAYDTRVSLGITYSFGAAGSRDVRKRAPLPNIENWMAVTSSILE